LNASQISQIFCDLSSPTSLRQLVLNGGEGSAKVSLNSRLKIGMNLAKAVLFFHTVHFVHKSIRPETVLVFKNTEGSLANSYLLGFGKFHLENTRTSLKGDAPWNTNIYRHPKRQGLNPEDE